MSQETITVVVHLLGSDYRFTCPPVEQEELLEAAHHLDCKMREIRERSNKSLALESVAIIAALNLSHELLQQQRQAAEMDVLLNNRMRDLLQKVDAALSQAMATEL